VDRRWRSLKKIVRLWVDLFDEHKLLTYASAIALRMFIAAVACTLFALGILGASHQQQLWQQTIGPEIEPKVLPHVFDGIDQTVNRVFSSSTAGLLALAAALAIWEVSGIIRAGIGALDEIYGRPIRGPASRCRGALRSPSSRQCSEPSPSSGSDTSRAGGASRSWSCAGRRRQSSLRSRSR